MNNMKANKTMIKNTVYNLPSVLLYVLAIFLINISTSLGEVSQETQKHDSKLKLGIPFQNHAILQQKLPLPVWGTALPGSSIRIEFNNQVKTGLADAKGQWRLTLDPMQANKLKSVHDAPKGKVMQVTAKKNGKTETLKLSTSS